MKLLCVFPEDFMAHGANVNCLALGHKSGRVLVTGGDDKKVNLWAVGKHNCIMVIKISFLLQVEFYCNHYNWVINSEREKGRGICKEKL